MSARLHLPYGTLLRKRWGLDNLLDPEIDQLVKPLDVVKIVFPEKAMVQGMWFVKLNTDDVGLRYSKRKV